MLRFIPLSFAVISCVVLFTCVAIAQNTDPGFPFPDRDGKRIEDSKQVRDMLAKQQAERDKKEHEELLKRAETALALSEELDSAFEENPVVTPNDVKKLAELEKVVKKIRGELGGDDDQSVEESDDDDEKPVDLKSAFRVLRSTTVKLVDEIRKTTRFSISAVAIQSSNAVIRVIKFLRLKQ